MNTSTKTLLPLLLQICFITNALQAQNVFPSTGAAGIGTTTPNASALLEIKSTTRGLLISRMTKAQRDAIVSPAMGLMIYQTNSTPGFYYYSGTAWVAVTPKSKDWSLTGNAGTVAGTNFIGTTDAQALVFEVNNSKAGLLDYDILKANSAFGFQSLNSNTGSSNSAFGYQSLFSNTTGYNNTATGMNTLYANTTGYFNTANGFQALYHNTSGYFNTSNGFQSLAYNTTGYNNTANGAAALYANTIGSYNTATGQSALVSNTTGYENTANGYQALRSNTIGYDNTANGDAALYANTTGYRNTANGYVALYANTTGNYNTANGMSALYANTSGYDNTANGAGALYGNTMGYRNTANGFEALAYNTTGAYNTANGADALYNNTAGNYNTAIGTQALNGNTTGINNTALGWAADVSTVDLHNATAVGANALVNASDKVVVGDNSVTVIGGQVGWSTFSDGRFKTNIKVNVPGLAFINKLKPVTYNLELKSFDRFLGKKDSLINSRDAEYAISEKKLCTGFVAQDVEKAAQQIGYDFDGINRPQNDKDNYSLVYADFVPSLVKAVQELSSENDELKKKNDELESRLQKIEALQAVRQSVNNQQSIINSNDAPRLEQNVPNPFNNSTVINYTLPESFSSAQIIIADHSGKVLKQVSVSGSGKSSLQIDAFALSSGTYQYSLLVDGNIFSTRQMILTK